MFSLKNVHDKQIKNYYNDLIVNTTFFIDNLVLDLY